MSSSSAPDRRVRTSNLQSGLIQARWRKLTDLFRQPGRRPQKGHGSGESCAGRLARSRPCCADSMLYSRVFCFQRETFAKVLLSAGTLELSESRGPGVHPAWLSHDNAPTTIRFQRAGDRGDTGDLARPRWCANPRHAPPHESSQLTANGAPGITTAD